MHLCMEYPNSENRARIGMKKDKFCDICREVGIEVVDSTEHNLFTCECLSGETYAAKQRQEIFTMIATLKGLNPVTLNSVQESDIQQAVLLLLNPTSSGIHPKLRLQIDSPYIKLIFLRIQAYVLTAHNLRLKHGELLEAKQVVRPRKLARKKKSSHDNLGGVGGLSSGSKQKVNLITNFFRSEKTKQNSNVYTSQIGAT